MDQLVLILIVVFVCVVGVGLAVTQDRPPVDPHDEGEWPDFDDDGNIDPDGYYDEDPDYLTDEDPGDENPPRGRTYGAENTIDDVNSGHRI